MPPSSSNENTNVDLKNVRDEFYGRTFVDKEKFGEFIDDYGSSQDRNALHQGLNVEYRINVKYQVDGSNLGVDWKIYETKTAFSTMETVYGTIDDIVKFLKTKVIETVYMYEDSKKEIISISIQRVYINKANVINK